jgi:hypothetical protein
MSEALPPPSDWLFEVAYSPPAIHQPVPYPNVLDPRTGEPLTAPAIAGLHRRLRDVLLHNADTFLDGQLGLILPEELGISEAAAELARLCLFGAIATAQTQLEPPAEGEAV